VRLAFAALNHPWLAQATGLGEALALCSDDEELLPSLDALLASVS